MNFPNRRRTLESLRSRTSGQDENGHTGWRRSCCSDSCSRRRRKRQTQGPVRITLDEAIQMALQHNHNMLAARTTIQQSQAEEITANLRPNPSLFADWEYLPLTQVLSKHAVSSRLNRGGPRSRLPDRARARNGSIDCRRRKISRRRPSRLWPTTSAALASVSPHCLSMCSSPNRRSNSLEH